MFGELLDKFTKTKKDKNLINVIRNLKKRKSQWTALKSRLCKLFENIGVYWRVQEK